MILGTRGSPLALAQTEWVKGQLAAAVPGLAVTHTVIRTSGDERPSAQLPTDAPPVGGIGIFVKEIEDTLLRGGIDAAVHSLKDLPVQLPDGLVLACVPSREDPRDVLVSRQGLSLKDLPRGARVGTGSPRRAAQLLHARGDLVIVPTSGNVGTRVRRMHEQGMDAIVLAAAGLARLGLLRPGALENAAAAPIPEDVCLPAPGQGALGLEARASDDGARTALSSIADPAAAAEVEAERAFLKDLGGGCGVPIAALGRCAGRSLTLRGVVASPDGARLVAVALSGDAGRAADLGRRLAVEALARGAREILDNAPS